MLRRHLEQYGRPVALYSDRHSIFRINIADFNQRFAVAPRSGADAHRPLRHRARELDLLLSEQEERTLSKNLTVPFRNVAY